jgi:hypothetical protein
MKKKNKPKSHWVIISISIVAVIVVLFFALGYWETMKEDKKGSEAWCDKTYNEIDTDVQNANYCINDGDCRTLILGGMYVEFGCFHFINKKVNSSELYGRMTDYTLECNRVIDKCSETPEPICVNGKCVAKV